MSCNIFFFPRTQLVHHIYIDLYLNNLRETQHDCRMAYLHNRYARTTFAIIRIKNPSWLVFNSTRRRRWGREIQMLATLRFGSSSVTVAGVAFCDQNVAAAKWKGFLSFLKNFPSGRAQEEKREKLLPFSWRFLMRVCYLTCDVCCSNTTTDGRKCVVFFLFC